MTKTISQLRKEANKAPKYVLKMDGLDLFISDKQGLTGCNLTDKINEARKYSVGFDNENIKVGVWESEAKRMMNTDIKFNIVYI